MKYLFACRLCGLVFTVKGDELDKAPKPTGGVYHDCEDEWVGYKGVAQMVGCKDGD